jgi:hypothetical protein
VLLELAKTLLPCSTATDPERIVLLSVKTSDIVDEERPRTLKGENRENAG